VPRFRFIAAFALTALLAFSEPFAITDSYRADQRIAHSTWKAACRLSYYETCPKRGPALRRSPIVGEMAEAYGLYWMGSDVIWVDTTLSGTRLWLTTFHEQIHYIQGLNYVDVEGYSKLNNCLIEREAMELTNKYGLELKVVASFLRTVEVWRELYNCKPGTPTRIMHTHG
jgi:hypothetical protein